MCIFYVPEGGSDIFFMYLRGGSTLFYIYMNRWNVAKQHMHFSIISWSNIRTFLIMSRSNIRTFSVCPTPFLKRWLCPCVEMLNYYWTRVGHCFFICDLLMGKLPGRGGRILCGWLNVFSRWALFVRKGGSTIFFNPQRGGVKHFFHIFVIFHNDETIFLLLGPLQYFNLEFYLLIRYFMLPFYTVWSAL